MSVTTNSGLTEEGHRSASNAVITCLYSYTNVGNVIPWRAGAADITGCICDKEKETRNICSQIHILVTEMS